MKALRGRNFLLSIESILVSFALARAAALEQGLAFVGVMRPPHTPTPNKGLCPPLFRFEARAAIHAEDSAHGLALLPMLKYQNAQLCRRRSPRIPYISQTAADRGLATNLQ